MAAIPKEATAPIARTPQISSKIAKRRASDSVPLSGSDPSQATTEKNTKASPAAINNQGTIAPPPGGAVYRGLSPI